MPEVVVLGAGPAGSAVAIWLADVGVQVTVIERSSRPCSVLDGLTIDADEVLGYPGMQLADVMARWRDHLMSRDDIELWLGRSPVAGRHGPRGWELSLSDGQRLRAHALVVATGLRPRRLPAGVLESSSLARPLDPVRLTERRATLEGQRVLLLGGGDNALENAIYLAERGHHVTVATRAGWRARRQFLQPAAQHPRIALRRDAGTPVSLRHGAGGARWMIRWPTATEPEAFDEVALLWGYEPDLPTTLEWPADPLAAGLFLAGDVSQQWMPGAACAAGHGAHIGRLVSAWLDDQGRPGGPLSLMQA